MSDPIHTKPSVGPYVGVSRDEIRVVPGVGTFRILLYGAYNAYGLIGSEMNGIAVLDEIEKQVICDLIGKEDSGYHGPSAKQTELFEKMLTMSPEAFVETVNESGRARHPLQVDKTPSMRAILINPFNRTVTEVNYNGDYKSIYTHLTELEMGVRVSTFDVVGIDDQGNSVFVDDEGLMKNNVLFAIEGYPQPLAGKGLVLGTNEEGESVATTLTVEQVTKMVNFAPRL